MINILLAVTLTDYIVHISICVILSAVMFTHHTYLLCSSIPLNLTIKTVVVTAAAIISLTGSARNTANTLSGSINGSMNISGISYISFLKHARIRLTFA